MLFFLFKNVYLKFLYFLAF